MLDVSHISFSWGRRPVLEDVAFQVAPGEIAALVGANGAGKTTLLRILAGLVLPVSGEIRANGVDAFRSPLSYRRAMGYLPERTSSDGEMAVRAYLKYRALLRGEMSKKIRHRVVEAMELCGLEGVAETPLGVLSHGQRRRVALADAILLRPRLLFLDDLLAGLDVDARASLSKVLAALSSFAAVVVSGHELDELAVHASKFLVLKGGRVFGVKTAAGARTILRSVSVKEDVQ